MEEKLSPRYQLLKGGRTPWIWFILLDFINKLLEATFLLVHTEPCTLSITSGESSRYDTKLNRLDCYKI
jgi:hypothetical protein